MKKILLFFIAISSPFLLLSQSGKADWFVFNILNSGMKSNHVNMVAIDKGGTIWVGATSEDGGLVQFDGKDWTFYSTSNSPIPDNRVNTVVIEGTGKKWIGTDGGVASLHRGEWNVYHSANSGIPTNTIRCLTIDNNGDKWMGTAAGLVRLSGTTWSTFKTTNSALPVNIIDAVAVDENNGLWIGTPKGLVRYEQGKSAIDSKNWSVLTRKNSGLPSDAISCIQIDFNKNVWVGTKSKGVAMYNGRDWKVFDKSSGLPGNVITALVADQGGEMWVGTTSGLALYKSDGSWETFRAEGSDLSDDLITNLVVDIKGNKWIGTDNGLSVFQEGGLAFSTYTAKYLFKSESIAKQLNEPAEGSEQLFRGSGDPLKGLNVATAIKEMEVGKYYALIIGIDNYTGAWSSLRNAVNDSKAVEQLLRSKYKFDVFKTLTNEQATRASIIRELEWLVENVKEKDNVFVYYSGHGEFKQSLNKGYWVPVDATTASTSQYVSNSDLKAFLGGIKSKHTLLVADACFSGDIFRGSTMAVPFENSERYYKKNHALISRQALTSGGVEPVMDGGKDGHSVFAYYFLKALSANQSQFYDASELYNSIRIPVINNSVQSPNFKPIHDTGDEGGQFIFIQKS
ncbi:MAG: caspase family protein [Flavobacteriales bacterium]|nr:caspase family protein [Flavobacteriales bacterium]